MQKIFFPETYRGYVITKPQKLTSGAYKVYVNRIDGSLVMDGEGVTEHDAHKRAMDNIDLLLDQKNTFNIF